MIRCIGYELYKSMVQKKGILIFVVYFIFKIISVVTSPGVQHNKENKYLINSRLDAWIAFCCIDDPEMIIAIIEQYPEFRAYYEQIYDICRNIEGVMDMFSKELQELDRNTVQLMIDEMQEDLKQKGKELDLINQKLGEKNQELDEKNQELDEKNQELNEKNQELQAALARIHEIEEEKKKANQ